MAENQRYFIHLAYNGASFHGWQIQPNAPSVQQTLERALTLLLGNPTAVVGAGRTDAGVNALMMIAHFDAEQGAIADCGVFAQRLNAMTGPDISVYSITPVDKEAHARFDATARTYFYYVCIGRNPFLKNLAWSTPRMLDFDAMNRAAELLLDIEDFTSFAKLHSDNKTNICHVTEARWEPVHTEFGDMYVFRITANRFLRNMVRAVVGTLVDVGRGKITIDQFKSIIAQRNRCAAGTSMPGHALYLAKITYPYYEPV